MIDTLTVLTYLLTHDAGHTKQLTLHALFSEKQSSTALVQPAKSPQLNWKGVPPEASSLVLIVKDAQPAKNTGKSNYYWVAYNLPVSVKGLPFDGSRDINFKNQIQQYHSPWASKNPPASIAIELYALDKRFSVTEKMTGESLEAKIKSHVIAKGVIIDHSLEKV